MRACTVRRCAAFTLRSLCNSNETESFISVMLIWFETCLEGSVKSETILNVQTNWSSAQVLHICPVALWEWDSCLCVRDGVCVFVAPCEAAVFPMTLCAPSQRPMMLWRWGSVLSVNTPLRYNVNALMALSAPQPSFSSTAQLTLC